MQISDQINYIRNKYIKYAQSQRINKLPMSLYDPVNYIMNIGGKRLRPVVLLVINEMYAPLDLSSFSAAFAFELFHNFSLVHDDIMDSADVRRKQPTVHKKFGENTAILSGDIMLIQVYDYLLQTHNNPKEIITIFNKVATLVCEGQQKDMDFEERKDVGLEDYIDMISGKTAALIAGAMEVGAKIGGGDEIDCKHWYNFGFNLGISFQIRDDILDTYGDEASFGKRIGGDIIEDKNSILMVLARQCGEQNVLEKLNQAQSLQDQEKIDTITGIYNEMGVHEKAIELEDKYYQIALSSLAKIKLNDATKSPIVGLAQKMMARTV